MGRPFDFSEREERMHGRCINWGRAMRGGLPDDYFEEDEPLPTPDELDAEIIERVMCKMRWSKHLHFKVMQYIYLRHRSTIEASNYFRKSEWWVRKRQREGIDFLIRHCPDT